MKRFVISESEKTHIRNLYSIKEVEAEKVVSGLFNMAKDIAKKLEAGQQTTDTGETTSSVDTPLGTEVAIGSKDKLSSPLKKYYVNPKSAFGVKRDTLDKVPHSGADFTAAQGEPIYAPGDGSVRTADKSGYNGGCGGTLYITHSNGLESRFCHLSDIFVTPGQQVKRGDKVGLVGGTRNTPGAGLSTGPHLHYTLVKGTSNKREDLLNPEDYVEKKFYNKDDGKYYSA
jgi:murein DD-endopeptidase MepM/ murein hydrolase activator NlpD